jgi:glycerol-3-phosphate dehydrogenase subunit C
MSEDAHATDDGSPGHTLGNSESDDHTDSGPTQVFGDGAASDLRPGADDCYKCSTCDTNCPVAEVDDSFPGPKFQGPEQWRLNDRADDHSFDESIMDCSNCMRCDTSCPAGVSLSEMHNTARAEYVTEELSPFSRRYWRNRVLANYRTAASIASRVPRLANAVAGNRLASWLGERLLGLTSERDIPTFATETFAEWWATRGGAATSRERAADARSAAAAERKKRIAYFHGCYTNYNTPAVGKALVRVFEHFGYEVVVPEQGCSGTPMFANGFLGDARRHAERTVPAFADRIAEGYDAICSCTSCSMALRQEYPELFDFDGVDRVAGNTYEALEYLRIHEDLKGALADASLDGEQFTYHAPCHARSQGLDRQALELFAVLDGVTVSDAGDSCSGISGTYGWKADKYDNSMAIGEEMFDEMTAAEADTGLTECPTCAMQMEHGTGYEIRHPIEVVEAALVE